MKRRTGGEAKVTPLQAEGHELSLSLYFKNVENLVHSKTGASSRENQITGIGLTFVIMIVNILCKKR